MLAAAELLLTRIGVDGLRVDSTKSIRKLPSAEQDGHGAHLLAELVALCRQQGKLAIAEDLEDGDGLLQRGASGVWWVYGWRKWSLFEAFCFYEEVPWLSRSGSSGGAASDSISSGIWRSSVGSTTPW